MSVEWPPPILRIGTQKQLSETSPEGCAYALTVTEAREAEELLGLYNDLDYVVRLAEMLTLLLRERGQKKQSEGVREVPLYGPDEGDETYVQRALWEAALVAYGRCFHKGKRHCLNENVFEGQPEAILVWHRYFKNTRDKHVAHSVNPFEECVTGAHIVDRDTAPRLVGVFNLHVQRSGESVETVDSLKQLAVYVREVVERKRKEASGRLWRKAASLSPEELRNLPELEVTPEQKFNTAGKQRR